MENINKILIPENKRKVQEYMSEKYSLGIEYSDDIINSQQLVKGILDKKLYLPDNNFVMECRDQIQSLIDSSLTLNYRLEGGILGFIIGGVICLLSTDLKINWLLFGALFGYLIGKQIGKFIQKNDLSNNKQYDDLGLLIQHLEVQSNWIKMKSKELKYDVNSYRIILENLLINLKLASFSNHVNNYKQKKKFQILLKNFQQIFCKKDETKAILLSSLIFNLILELNEESMDAVEDKIAFYVFNVYLPYKRIMEYKMNCVVKRNLAYISVSNIINNWMIQKMIKNHKYSHETDIKQIQDNFQFRSKNKIKIKSLKKYFIKQSNFVLVQNNKYEQDHLQQPVIEIKNVLNTNVQIQPQNMQNLFLQIPKSHKKNTTNLVSLQQKMNYQSPLKINQSQSLALGPEEMKLEVINSQDNDNDNSDQSIIQIFYQELKYSRLINTSNSKICHKRDINFIKINQVVLEQSQHQDWLYSVEQSKVFQENNQTMNIPQDLKNNYIQIIELLNDQQYKWESVCDKESIKIQKYQPSDNPAVIVRAEAIIEDVDIETIFEQIYDIDQRVKWDQVCTNFQLLEKQQYYEYVYYSLKNSFIGVSTRDFCQKRAFLKDYPSKGQITIQFKSHEHKNAPQIKGNIRAETSIAGYVLQQVPFDNKNCKVMIISQCDVKGKIPKYIVNFVASRAPSDWVNNLKKACKKAVQLKKIQV